MEWNESESTLLHVCMCLCVHLGMCEVVCAMHMYQEIKGQTLMLFSKSHSSTVLELYRPGWPWAYRNLPVSASQVLGLKKKKHVPLALALTLLFKKTLLILIYVYVPQRPEEGVRSLEVRVTGSFKLPGLGAGNLI